MKKRLLPLVMLCALSMVACGNSEIDKINQMVIDATEQTKAAKSAQEVANIATTLQAEMDKIAAESGNKLSFGKSVDETLNAYQEAAAAKLAEFDIKLEVE